MTRQETVLGKLYKSNVNTIARDCEYEVVKKNKHTCWVKLWEDGAETDKIFKDVKYSVLSEIEGENDLKGTQRSPFGIGS